MTTAETAEWCRRARERSASIERELDALTAEYTGSCYVCTPVNGFDAPCGLCGSYSHDRQYCPRDTYHTCARSHRCADRDPCGCAA